LKYTELAEMMKAGLQPVIEFTAEAKEHDLEPEPGMRCKVLSSYDCEDGCATLRCSFAEYQRYNEPFATSDYFDSDHNPTLTWFETPYYPADGIYDIYVDMDDEYELMFTVVEMSPVYQHYLDSNSNLSYVSWMEHELQRIAKYV